MKAVRIHQFGGPEVIVYEDAPDAVAGPGDAVIRVHAAGVNQADWKIREGQFEADTPHTLPLILGWDVAGLVESVSAGVTNVKVGDAVYANADGARDGANAELVAVKADTIALKPKALSFVDAASVPIVGLAAWQSLITAGSLSVGQRVLIHGAAGGVGSMAVQFARWKGAYIIGTAASADREFVSSLGADEVIDYTTVRFEDVVRDADLVFDPIGGDTQSRSWQVLRQGGRLVSIAEEPDPKLAAELGVTAQIVYATPNADDLTKIAELVDLGLVKTFVEKVLPLAETRQAHELIQAHKVRGKIVLQVVD